MQPKQARTEMQNRVRQPQAQAQQAQAPQAQAPPNQPQAQAQQMQTPPNQAQAQAHQTQPQAQQPQANPQAQQAQVPLNQAQAQAQQPQTPPNQAQAQAQQTQAQQTQAQQTQAQQTQAPQTQAPPNQQQPQPPPPRPGSMRAWLSAARPKTLPASLAPVLVGTAVAFAEGRARPLVAFTCLAVALLLQLAANFVNDYADFERGSDGPQRLGPPRAAQQGWLGVGQLKRAALLTLAAAALCGLTLVALGGVPILIGGALALLCAVAYTAGPRPLAYHGLGDPAVFVFFGLLATAGTYYVQAGRLSGAALASGVCIGFLATALLAVNNLRDIEGDAAAGKRTLAVRLGERGARRYTAALLAAAYAMTAPLAMLGPGPFAALPLLSLPLAVPLWQGILGAPPAALNRTLAGVARLELAFAVLLAAGFGFGRWAS